MTDLHHVEALLEDGDDAWVRRQWTALAQAGLPSLHDHRSESNRPHVTVTVVETWDAADTAPPVSGLPMTVPLGPLAVFGTRRLTLVRALVVTEPLLAVRRDVVGRLASPARRFYEDGRWVPHLTLAQRLDTTQLARALEVLGAVDAPDAVTLQRLRHWDAEARVVRPFPDITRRSGAD